MNAKRNAIQHANAALEGAWDGTLPVHPERIASLTTITLTRGGEKTQHGIIMKGMSDWDLNGDSGYAEFRENDPGQPFWCVYNTDERPDRQRFTQAHELGHVVLGHVVDGNKPKRDASFAPRGDLDEVAANYFAASLLMPEQLVREMAEYITNVEMLASRFRVSPSAMGNRLKNLGIV